MVKGCISFAIFQKFWRKGVSLLPFFRKFSKFFPKIQLGHDFFLNNFFSVIFTKLKKGPKKRPFSRVIVKKSKFSKN